MTAGGSGASTRFHARIAYEPALDGVRALAVAAVLLYHGGFDVLRGGFLGVSTFFTLSGFLITSILLAEHARTGTVRLSAFWERRLRRILPASFTGLVLAALFVALYGDAYQLEHLVGDAIATLGSAVNWWFVFTRRDYADIFGSPSPVQHYWSLAIEEQFYLVFPVFFLGVARRTRRPRRTLGTAIGILLAASVGLMAALSRTDVTTARLYYGTDTRAAELLAGALLAVVYRGTADRRARPPSRWAYDALGAIGLAVTVAFWCTTHQQDGRLYAGGLAVYALASVALLVGALGSRGPMHHLLALPFMQGLGRVSYGTYVYHFPIFLWLTPERVHLSEWPLFAARVATTLVVALASYRWLEEPVRTGRMVVGANRWRAPLVATCCLAVTFVLVHRSAGSTPTVAVSRRVLDDSMPATGMPPLRVMVVGDSVARNLADGLTRWSGLNADLALRNSTRDGCGIARGDSEDSRDARLRALDCTQWRASWSDTVAQFDPMLVVVYTGGWDLMDREIPGSPAARSIADAAYRTWLEAEFSRAVDVFASRGARVLWLSSACVRPPTIGPEGVYDPQKIHLLNDVIADVARADPSRVRYVDLFSLVCPRGSFTNTLNGFDDARPDGVHFSVAASDWLAQWLWHRLWREATDTDWRRSQAQP